MGTQPVLDVASTDPLKHLQMCKSRLPPVTLSSTSNRRRRNNIGVITKLAPKYLLYLSQTVATTAQS